MKTPVVIALLIMPLLSLTAAETYLFGTAANPGKAEVSEKDGCYQVVCTFKSTGSHRRDEDLNELKAKENLSARDRELQAREKGQSVFGHGSRHDLAEKAEKIGNRSDLCLPSPG